MKPPKHILPIIVIAQFCCTSLWFAGNGVIQDLLLTFDLEESALGHLTSAIQLGFIAGTLVFAILTIADRFSPSKVFFVSAALAAVFNLGIIWEGNSLWSILLIRFMTGFFLAGIYPVGMKIAADYYEEGLGKSLGFLVGALVVGTAFPHLLKDLTSDFPWKSVFVLTSSLSVLGGVLMVSLVPDGPYRKPCQKVDLTAFFSVFKSQQFRSAAFGYFGHMWELYAFWAFVPVMLFTYTEVHAIEGLNIPMWSFLIIGLGGIACVIGGYLAQARGTQKIAFLSLLLSCLCCLLSPLAFGLESEVLFISFLLFWGMVVITDSPLFSTLVAHSASPEIKGTALTIVNSIGYMITIVSIQLINTVRDMTDSTGMYALLAIGPILGLLALRKRM